MAPLISNGLTVPTRVPDDWFPVAGVTVPNWAFTPAAAVRLREEEQAKSVDYVVVRSAIPDYSACATYCALAHLWPVWYAEMQRPRNLPCTCAGAATPPTPPKRPRHDWVTMATVAKRAVNDDGGDGGDGSGDGGGDSASSSSGVDTSVGDKATKDAEAEDGKVAPDVSDVPHADTADSADSASDVDTAATQCQAGDFDCTCQEYCDKGDTGTFPVYHATNSSGEDDAGSSTTVYCVNCHAVNVTDGVVPRAAAAAAAPKDGLSVWAFVRRLWQGGEE